MHFEYLSLFFEVFRRHPVGAFPKLYIYSRQRMFVITFLEVSLMALAQPKRLFWRCIMGSFPFSESIRLMNLFQLLPSCFSEISFSCRNLNVQFPKVLIRTLISLKLVLLTKQQCWKEKLKRLVSLFPQQLHILPSCVFVHGEHFLGTDFMSFIYRQVSWEDYDAQVWGGKYQLSLHKFQHYLWCNSSKPSFFFRFPGNFFTIALSW